MFQNTNLRRAGDAKISRFCLNLRQIIASSRGKELVQVTRIVFLIDGFNLYHALDYRREYHKYKWINLARLPKCFVTDKKDSLEAVYYFTTLATWDPGKVSRHRLFIRAQEAEGVNVVYGEFKRRIDTAPYVEDISDPLRKSKLT